MTRPCIRTLSVLLTAICLDGYSARLYALGFIVEGGSDIVIGQRPPLSTIRERRDLGPDSFDRPVTYSAPRIEREAEFGRAETKKFEVLADYGHIQTRGNVNADGFLTPRTGTGTLVAASQGFAAWDDTLTLHGGTGNLLYRLRTTLTVDAVPEGGPVEFLMNSAASAAGTAQGSRKPLVVNDNSQINSSLPVHKKPEALFIGRHGDQVILTGALFAYAAVKPDNGGGHAVLNFDAFGSSKGAFVNVEPVTPGATYRTESNANYGQTSIVAKSDVQRLFGVIYAGAKLPQSAVGVLALLTDNELLGIAGLAAVYDQAMGLVEFKEMLTRLFRDPPDQSYRDKITPQFVSIPPIETQLKTTTHPALIELANTFLSNSSLKAGLLQAAGATLERLSGAEEAGDFLSAALQREAFKEFSLEYSTAAYRAADLSNELLNELRKAGLVDLAITKADIELFKDKLRVDGLPGLELALLSQAGLSPTDIQELIQQLLTVEAEDGSLFSVFEDISSLNDVLGALLASPDIFLPREGGDPDGNHTPVPEPSTYSLMAIGLMLIVLLRRYNIASRV